VILEANLALHTLNVLNDSQNLSLVQNAVLPFSEHLYHMLATIRGPETLNSAWSFKPSTRSAPGLNFTSSPN